MIELFYEDINRTKNIICYGAGRYIEKITRVLSPEHLEKIRCVVDQNYANMADAIKIGDCSIPVMSPDILSDISEDTIVIITPVKYIDIYNAIKATVSGKIYALRLLVAVKLDEDALCIPMPHTFRLLKEQKIPKKIHYCWFGDSEIPDFNKKCIESWRKYCEGYEIVEWNEKNYDIEKNGYMYEAYKRKKWGFVPDYARLDIVYKHGGIYLDTDVEIIAPIDDFLYQDAFVGFENEKNINLGSGFGAKKGNNIIKLLMDDYEKRTFINADGTINDEPSPQIQSKSLEKIGLVRNGHYQHIDSLTVFPEKILCGKSMATGMISAIKETHMIHHYDGSWVVDSKKEFRNSIYDHISKIYKKNTFDLHVICS